MSCNQAAECQTMEPQSYKLEASRSKATPSPLFRLPVELFLYALGYLTTKELKTLSLVDRTFMVLTMPSIYKNITLWYPPNQYPSLLEKALSASTAAPSTSSCSLIDIHSHVRRLTLTSESSGQFLPNYSTTITRYNIQASDNIDIPLETFILSVCNTIDNALPNLHVLDWDLPVPISGTTLRVLLSSPAKHLRLEGVILDQEACSLGDEQQLSVETLSLNISPKPAAQPHRVVPSPFFDNLLRRSRSTLRQLRWTGYFDFEDIYISSTADQFCCLRSLTLDTIARNCDNVIQLLLGPLTRVETLAMDTMTPSACNFFGTRGHIAPLKHFCWLIHDQGDFAPFDQIMNFIRENNQLETLHIPGPVSTTFLSQSLLPMLTRDFKSLTSLHLVWASPNIPEEALEHIASIESLNHIWLSAGNQSGMRNTWKIDHELIITHLARLPRLLTLAFSRDTYAVNAHPLAPRSWDYYTSQSLPADLDISMHLSPADFDVYQGRGVDFAQGRLQQIALRRLAWESWHAERMLELGNQYALHFPCLRWLFIGQHVLTSSSSGSFDFASRPAQRDPGMTVLQERMSLTLWRPT